MSERAKATAWRFFQEQDRLRGGPAEELCAEGYVAYLGSYPPLGLEGHQGFAATFYSGFPDMSHTLEDSFADGNRVALRFVITGTNTGTFMGAPPTGNAISLEVISLMTVDDSGEKVTELHSQFDQVALMQQLGVMPE